MITKQEILEDFWEQFPQYKEMTPTYESIRFEEEEILEWNIDWLDFIRNKINFQLANLDTLQNITQIIKLE